MEITANAVQTVAANQDVLFTNVAIAGNSSTVHRSGSGQVTLRGLTNCQCRARFRVTFGGNIAVPADGILLDQFHQLLLLMVNLSIPLP